MRKLGAVCSVADTGDTRPALASAGARKRHRRMVHRSRSYAEELERKNEELQRLLRGFDPVTQHDTLSPREPGVGSASQASGRAQFAPRLPR